MPRINRHTRGAAIPLPSQDDVLQVSKKTFPENSGSLRHQAPQKQEPILLTWGPPAATQAPCIYIRRMNEWMNKYINIENREDGRCPPSHPCSFKIFDNHPTITTTPTQILSPRGSHRADPILPSKTGHMTGSRKVTNPAWTTKSSQVFTILTIRKGGLWALSTRWAWSCLGPLCQCVKRCTPGRNRHDERQSKNKSGRDWTSGSSHTWASSLTSGYKSINCFFASWKMKEFELIHFSFFFYSKSEI